MENFILPITNFPIISILILLYKMLPLSTYKISFFYYINKILYKYKKKNQGIFLIIIIILLNYIF